MTRQQPTEAARLKRRKTALQLRIEGKTFEQIGRALGITKQAAHESVGRELELAARENRAHAQHALQLELDRVDFVLRSLTPAVVKSDPKAAQAYLKAMERRAKLLGLDRPERHEIATVGASDPSTIHARLGAIAARAAGPDAPGAAGSADPGTAGDPHAGG